MNDFKKGNFVNDAEKMRDFHRLTKEEFLQSYSYLTEEEYDNTRSIIGEIKGFVECEVGFYIIYGKWQKRYYPENTEDGYCFKDRVAFENKDGVCYIPEGDFEDYFEDFTERYDSECGYTYEEIEERVKERFLNAAPHIIEDYTEMVFDAVNWMYICTYLEEFEPEY